MAGFRYDGNKTRLYKQLEKYLPSANRFNMYIEPFLGGGGMLFSMLQNGKLDHLQYILVNDKSKIIYYLFKYVMDSETNAELEQLIINSYSNEIDFKVYSKEVKGFESKDVLTVQDVFKWLYVKYYGGVFGYCLDKVGYKKGLTDIVRVAINKEIKLANKDAIMFCKAIRFRTQKDKTRFNENPFYFIDPPYMSTKAVDYKANITVEYMQELIKAIKEKTGFAYIRTSVMFTHTRHEELEQMLINEGFFIHYLEEFKDSKKSGQEFVAINYELEEQKKLF